MRIDTDMRVAPTAVDVGVMSIPGGTYLCAPNYCRRYPPEARMPQEVDTSTCHRPFRCLVRETSPG